MVSGAVRRILWLSVFWYCFYASWPWTRLERVDGGPEGKGRVSVELSHGVGSAPATIHALAKIDVSPENLRLTLTIESDSFYRASEFDLRERYSDQRSFDWWIRELPCGSYVLRASLQYAHNLKIETAADSRPFEVLGIGCDRGI